MDWRPDRHPAIGPMPGISPQPPPQPLTHDPTPAAPRPAPGAPGYQVTPELLAQRAKQLREDAIAPDDRDMPLLTTCPDKSIFGCPKLAEAAAAYHARRKEAFARMYADQVALAGHLEANATHYRTREDYLAEVFTTPPAPPPALA
ncbi:hypothetical protein GCM10023321_85560 [Pseudonocardia eucalypti]|uniref:Uncharacterized protein n=1 Tax=Pseudonocardia eucalypti TaxID=648755 RepID=A0ABP9RG76_9PSEU|nr:hypothetical protein [Pseudonocardia eucalypti]MBB6380762.1 hypothetical protein [Pseudonocardia eucalypti]